VDNASLQSRHFMEQRSLQEVCEAMKVRLDEYYLQHPDEAKAHRSWKRRKALKGVFVGVLWFMVIIVLPHVIDFIYPNMVPLLCWLNLSIICEGP
jgi:hypothetical protein